MVFLEPTQKPKEKTPSIKKSSGPRTFSCPAIPLSRTRVRAKILSIFAYHPITSYLCPVIYYYGDKKNRCLIGIGLKNIYPFVCSFETSSIRPNKFKLWKCPFPHIHVWNKARQAGKMDLDESLNLDLFSLVHIFTILSRFLYKLENVNTVWAEFFVFLTWREWNWRKIKSSETKTRCQMLKVPELETQKD